MNYFRYNHSHQLILRPYLNEYVYKNIKDIALKKNISIPKLTQMIGKSVTYFDGMKYNRMCPRADTLTEISCALDVDITKLFEGIPEELIQEQEPECYTKQQPRDRRVSPKTETSSYKIRQAQKAREELKRKKKLYPWYKTPSSYPVSPSLCKSCQYRSGDSYVVAKCNYSSITGNCKLDGGEKGCSFYVKGKRLEPRKAISIAKQGNGLQYYEEV